MLYQFVENRIPVFALKLLIMTDNFCLTPKFNLMTITNKILPKIFLKCTILTIRRDTEIFLLGSRFELTCYNLLVFLIVVIHGLPDLHHPNDHEWFCPVAIEVMAAMAADRPKSRSQSSLSRKSSNSSTRKSSAPPVQSSANMQTCKLRMTACH